MMAIQSRFYLGNVVEGYNEKFHLDFHTDVQSTFKKNRRLN